jgi:uncharacterized protein
MSDQQHPTIALVNRFCDAIEAGDLAALNGCFRPDAKIWHNNDNLFATVEQNSAGAVYFFENFSKRRYGTRRIQLLEKGALLQFVATIEKADGRSFDWPGCVVYEIVDGQIVTLEEYIDIGSMQAAVG